MTNEELVALIQAGERDRLPELWDQVERFVAKQANKLLMALELSGVQSGLEFEDLYNSGYIALVSAADSYNQEQEALFITWLGYRLKTAFAEAGGYRSKRQARDPIRWASSMDAPVKAGADDGDKDALGDFITDPGAVQAFQDAEDRIYQEQLHAVLERALETLDADEEAVIRARYYEGRTLQEIGPRARTLGERALIHLRRPQIRRELEQFVEARTPYYLRVGVQAFHNTNESAVERIVFKREQMRGRLWRPEWEDKTAPTT